MHAATIFIVSCFSTNLALHSLSQQLCRDMHQRIQQTGHLYAGIPAYPPFPTGFNFVADDLFPTRALAAVDLKYLEETAMQFWSSINLKPGDIVVSLGNQQGRGATMCTGMTGVVIGFESVPESVEYASIQFSSGDFSDSLRHKERLNRLRIVCGIPSQALVSGATVDPCLLFPRVQFTSPGGQPGGHVVVVKPQFRQVRGLDNYGSDIIMDRMMLPLCNGRAVKFGLSLGCEVSGDVFINLSKIKELNTHAFMSMSRTGDPRHLIIDKDTPLTPTMFAAPEHTLDWFEGAGPTPLFGAWTSLAIVRSAARARVNGLAHASKVMTTLRAGPGAPAPPVSKLFFR